MRVDRLEALFGHFLTQLLLIEKKADERNRQAEERNRAAEERMARFEAEMREFKNEMREFKNEMRHDRKELSRKWGELANKMGTIVEDILAPNLRRLAREHFRFPDISYFAVRCERARDDNPSVKCEFDTVVGGPGAVILGEAKSTPRLEDADSFAAKRTDFFKFFSELAGRRLILVFGSWSIPEKVIGSLTALGIYAMQMGEETMELVNVGDLEGNKT